MGLKNKNMKNILIGFVGFVVIIGIAYYFIQNKLGADLDLVAVDQAGLVVDETDVSEDVYSHEVIGSSVDGRDIEAYRFGDGEKKLVYIGALHGGYEWNSALLSYELIDYLTENSDVVPADIEVVVIPVANPDGLYKVVGTSTRFAAMDAPQFDFASELSLDDTVVSGRFNANDVDLNRNFDCKWQADATWREYTVGAGTEAFSEPEAAALRDFLLPLSPEAVVFFHSASNGVYTSFCEDDALAGTEELLATYSEASGYERFDDYTYYEVTGDAADWLSTQGIPAITVELSTHDVIEWNKNLAGIEAMFELYSGVVEESDTLEVE